MPKEKERVSPWFIRKEIKFLLLFVLLDQSIKFQVLQMNLAVINKGIAFGFLPFIKPSFLIFLTGIFLILISVFYFSAGYSRILFPLKLILTGGFSNLVDRLIYGGVVDYFHLLFLPSFNLADLVISLGFLALLGKAVFSQ